MMTLHYSIRNFKKTMKEASDCMRYKITQIIMFFKNYIIYQKIKSKKF